ncbi:LysM peptidoglycan-binding domain-containing protein [Flavobacterium acetivorans]|uniref:LysM peptidoglycan-binding domain-containing protein n=1 Tax=Flavobacterium acetivorans TaxID=2893883 RepID=UPI001E2E5045|nr:LysM peptidoglycan-binding domain-containing protein [Flavobacterium sp. F-29]UFH35353.1 LysM peptidoglycan-binding domain-containing protein [Flavobacterium sp. F-29]
MKYFFAIYMTAFLFTTTVFSQGKMITHKIEKGETINQIAQKYKVTPFDIYQLNPDAQRGLTPNGTLLVPNKSTAKILIQQPKASTQPQTHEVVAKETLYGIEKKYGVSDQDLKKANPSIEKDGLQIGQILVIPSKNNSKATTAIQEKVVYHDVLAKETKYSIAKQYGITIEELEKRNPEIVANLPIGYRLVIKGNAPKVVKVIEKVEAQKEVLKPSFSKKTAATDYVMYEVKPKETLYSLSKMTGLSQEELIVINPELKNGVETGMKLMVPSKVLVSNDVRKESVTLSKKINNASRKRMVLLLPFNISKIEGDTVNSTIERLKKDKFLNMTLDFYSGALMAIDSAKVLGLPVDVEIYDSQETKNSSNVAAIVRDNKLELADAVVGPFYQSNAETTAQLLSAANVPVISPLSKDIGNPYANLFQTIPTVEVVRNTVFDYMRANKGNIIAVVDRKKESVIKYIQQYQKDVRFVAFKENGSVSAESLKSMLVKDKMNYVVMETGNTGMVKATIAAMVSAMAMYQVQLVILEPNETLDTDEINFSNLTKLKLMYPSVTRDNQSPEALVFKNKYRKLNNISSSDFATRGFDVTFDTLLRLSQDKSFEETANAIGTVQVDNKFEYYKKEDGGYTNKGVFVLYYDTDLIIKEAK